jgi:hypothetical protein
MDFKKYFRNLDMKEVGYYILIVAGLSFVVISAINRPDRYSNTQEWLNATDKSIPILESMGKGSLGTFSPPASDREFWDNVEDKPYQLPPPPPEILSTLNEVAILRMGTTQECFYPDGAWINNIEQALKALLNKDTHDTELFKKPLVDLLKTETGAIMANCIGLIGGKLDPKLVEEVKENLIQTIIEPYKKDLKLAQTKKMRFGFDSCPWIGNPGNWNAVCTANIIYIAMVVLDDKKELASLIAQSQENIETYLKSYEDDGYLSEGIRYWSYGFSHFILLSECLLKITNGEINLYEIPKVKKIIEFPLKAKIGENTNLNFEYYPLFTDNSNPIRDAKNNFEWYILSKRANLPFEVSSPRKHAYKDTRFDLLHSIPKPKETYSPIEIELPTDPSYFKSAGMLISRWAGGNEVLAIKGGTNSEDHNHNDIGSYTLFTKIQFDEMLPVTGDLGDIEYTRENIGTNRYKFDLLSSYGHPVPTVDEQLQNNHPNARAKVLLAKVDEDEDKISYDLIDAYSVKGLKKLQREVVSKKTKDQALIVTDKFESSRPIMFETPLIFPGIPEKINDKKFKMSIEGSAFEIEIFSRSPIETSLVPLDATGYKVTKRGNPKKLGDPHRLNIKLKNKQTDASISYKITKTTRINQPIPKKSIPPRLSPNATNAATPEKQPQISAFPTIPSPQNSLIRLKEDEKKPLSIWGIKTSPLEEQPPQLLLNNTSNLLEPTGPEGIRIRKNLWETQ